MELIVNYEKVNEDVHKLAMNSPVMKDTVIDATDIAPEAQAGTSAKLLAAACLNCFVETFAQAMAARDALIDSLKGSATVKKEKDDRGRTRLSSIDIRVEVGIDDAYLPHLEKCQKIMKRGCLITYSIEDAVKITHAIQRI